MVLNLVVWYLVVALAGWLAFPLAYRLLAFLPDRGLAFSRPLSLLLWGYIDWLLVSLGVLQNDAGGAVVALILVAGFMIWRLSRDGLREERDWLSQNRGLVLVTEGLFLLLFALWAVVRAANPDASGTEKPMELAFINSILRSPSFPPSDPWLSGYAISYYYFGYVIVAVLARMSATPGAVAFNLAIATWFALTGLAAYGLLYNLFHLWRKRDATAPGGAASSKGLLTPLLAPLFVLVVSNLEGFLEVLHACGAFWQNAGSGSATSGFWQWLNIQELVQPPTPPLNCVPNRPGGIRWWRASRVLQDFDIGGASREIIDEFPMFSYLLGDLHPHVLAMPFVLLAVGLALNMYLGLRENLAGALRVEEWVRTPGFWAAAVVLGGLSFLNTWDFPIYVALFAAAVVLAQFMSSGLHWGLLVTFIEVGLALGIAGGVLYFPFYLGFASQASGILPSLVFFTRGVYFWIMFGALLLPILAWLFWLGWRAWRSGRGPAFGSGLLIGSGVILGLWLLSTLLGVRDLANPNLAGIWGVTPGAPVLPQSIIRRFQSPGTWLSLLGVLALVWGLLQTFNPNRDANLTGSGLESEDGAPDPLDIPGDTAHEARATPFVLLLVLLGVGLTLFPEFFYLHDQFGWRMNTIFKFYFQTWMVWAIAAAFASVVLWQTLRKSWASVVFPVLWTALLLMSLVYPYYGIQARTGRLDPAAWSLDGSAYAQRNNPDEMDAIRWLQTAPYGVIAEAVGGSYTGFARVSMFSGLPTVLGWPGHESQWRGGASEIGTREPDIAQLYRARTWDQVNAILAKYHIRYVFVGALERSTYHPSETVFQQNLQVAFHNNAATIYEVPQMIYEQQQVNQP
jgi:YYY domain-containing protein